MARDAERPRRYRADGHAKQRRDGVRRAPCGHVTAADSLAYEFILISEEPEFDFEPSIKKRLVVGQKVRRQRIRIEALIGRVRVDAGKLKLSVRNAKAAQVIGQDQDVGVAERRLLPPIDLRAFIEWIESRALAWCVQDVGLEA